MQGGGDGGIILIGALRATSPFTPKKVFYPSTRFSSVFYSVHKKTPHVGAK